MKRILVVLTLFGSLQADSQSYRETSYWEGTLNAGDRDFAAALSWHHLHGFGKGKQRFKVGYGLRLTSYFNAQADYVTAPAKYTSGKESLGALFSENRTANFDTVRFTLAQVNFLNAAVYLTYTPPVLKDRLDIGMNIDVLGISIGQQQGGTYKTGIFNSAVKGTPTFINLLLISDSDRGSLNSEWYLRYWISARWAVKAGYEFLFTEYTLDRAVQQIPNSNDTNDRFRNKSSMLLLGLTFAPGRKAQ
jgi:hypothetical protein